MPKKTYKARRLRKTKRRYKGGFINAIGQGIKQGLKQAPREIMSSIRSKGSSYLQPSGSIANYAGNNIQNIIQSHHQELGSHVGKSLQNIKTSLTSSFNKSKSKITNPYLNPYAFASKSFVKPNIVKQPIIFNNKFTKQYQQPIQSPQSTQQLLE